MCKLAKITILFLLIIHTFSCAALSEPLPQGQKGEIAEQLAQKVLKAINAQAFFQAEGARWSYRGYHYMWHKGLNRVRVQLDDDLFTYVDLNTQKGWAIEAQQRLKPQNEASAIKKAIKAFNNDSFWAFAPFKIVDPGTQRALVSNSADDHRSPSGSLLVHYESGGSTPGDHYLWHLDANHRPYEWQMWVSLIPIGGVSSSWSKWKKTKAGAWVAQEHHIGPVTLTVKNIEVVSKFGELKNADSKLLGSWSDLYTL